MTRYRAVFFDVDGTLYRSKEYEEHLLLCVVKVLAEMLRVEKDVAFRLLQEKKREVKTVSRSVELLGLNRHVFYEKLANVVEVEKHLRPVPEVSETLVKIRSLGVVVGLHTNSGKKLASKVLNQLGVAPKCYDFLVTSDDAEPKPDVSGYRMLLAKSGVQSGEALYVGDRCEIELKTASELGMSTAYVGDGICRYAKYVLGSVRDVLSIL